ncbi:transcriptional regulator ArgP [Shewanella sp. NFH-SH190041]|uniref:LysR family transcriptional regulator ArgP n=1 Tax=Shewanella sp. NFH-SH190041 TaxID=2950245 RepID=UPI0021C45BF6|nr:LysR family transcriptional regulator ArgP [Shewanella sp. NFH-SH190041]BDM64794.1 transcriptional regulator ArgP [Shewanella sp. NFH-SH190041]
MFDYVQLKALAAVINCGGFERAAQQLNITQSAVSQRIRQLELKTGQPLLIRTNPVTATALGKKLLRHFAQVEMLEQELQTELADDTPQTPSKIKIAVNADTLATWFLPALAPLFQRKNWLLELIVDDESYTHHLLQNGEAVGCVTTTATPMTGCSSEPLGQMEYLCVATPQFQHRYFHNGVTPTSLALAPAVIFSTKDKLHDKFLQRYFAMAGGDYWQHTIPSSESFLESILQHMGYGLVAHLQAVPLLEQGRLVELTPGMRKQVPLYWQHWNIRAKQTTLIYRALMTRCRQLLLQP